MNKSAAKLRLNQKQRERRKKRRKKKRHGLGIVIVLIIIIAGVVCALKSGTEISKNIKYPVQYSDYIVKYSKENNLDPYLVISVIKQESNFVADARSQYAGGLMQLTEVTANECSQKLGLESVDYMDPETNIKLGCYLLRTLINRYKHVNTALAAYNAGSGNVDKWLSDPKYSKDGVTLYEIPFSETKYYVEKINKYIDEYKNNVNI